MRQEINHFQFHYWVFERMKLSFPQIYTHISKIIESSL